MHTSRRETLALTGAGLMAALTASAAVARCGAGPSPVRALFEEWQRLHEHLNDEAFWNALSPVAGDEELTRTCAAEHAVALCVLETPLRDPGDLAMKIVAATSNGTMPLDQEDTGRFAALILADARALIAQA